MQGPEGVLNVITIPPGAGLGQRIVLDGFRGAQFEYDQNNNLVGSWASVAGTDPYGNNYPQGLSITGQGIFSGSIIAGNISNTPIGGSVITGSDFNNGTIESTVYTMDANGGQIFVYASTQVVTQYTTTGTNSFVPPAGVTSITFEGIGGGGFGSNIGGGGPGAGGGGGGGGYGKRTGPVTPGNTYNFNVGAGATNAGGPGGDTIFTFDDATTGGGHGGKSSPNNKNPGSGGTGVGTTNFPGGSGGTGDAFANHGGGGGGGAAGKTGAGQNGANHNGTSGGGGGVGNSPGGTGGKGGDSGQAGANGGAAGGGGGGSGAGANSGGVGARGLGIITYLTGRALIGSWSAVAGTDSTGVAFPKGMMIDSINAPIVALDPVALNKAEVWHTISLAAGWSTVAGQPIPSYRMLPDGRVNIVGVATHAAFTTTTTFASVALPVPYHPLGIMVVSGNSLNEAPLEITASGNMSAFPGGVSCTACRFSGDYPVNL